MPTRIIVSEWTTNARGDKVPAAQIHYPAATWSDRLSQPDADILNGLDVALVTGELSASDAAAIEADNRYVVVPEGSVSEAARTALKTKLATVYHADVAELVTTEPDVVASLVDVGARPPWRAGMSVEVGDVFMYERNLYRVVQAHTTAAQWPPDAVPALFTRHYNTSGDNPDPFVQPTGAHDAYQIGDRVTFEGNIYESVIDNNVWSPTAYPAGWTLIGPA